MASTKINPPLYNGEDKNFSRYKIELKMWAEVTELPKAKMGIVVALSLPENDKTRIREQVMEDVKLEDLKKDDGLETLIKFMEKNWEKMIWKTVWKNMKSSKTVDGKVNRR